jgi:hypothetical protein
MIDWFFLCERHNNYLHKRKRKLNAIFWEIINNTIRNKNVKKIEIIFENKNYSKSKQSKNLILSRFVHF